MNYHGLVRPRITLYSLFHGFYSIENCFKLNRKLRVPSDEIIALCFYGQQCTVWPCMTQQHGLERPIVVFYGLVGSFIVFQGLAQSFMAFHGFVWPFYGLIWSFYGLLFENIVLNGLGWSFLAVIDPNSFGLVLLVCVLQVFTEKGAQCTYYNTFKLLERSFHNFLFLRHFQNLYNNIEFQDAKFLSFPSILICRFGFLRISCECVLPNN